MSFAFDFYLQVILISYRNFDFTKKGVFLKVVDIEDFTTVIFKTSFEIVDSCLTL